MNSLFIAFICEIEARIMTKARNKIHKKRILCFHTVRKRRFKGFRFNYGNPKSLHT